MCLRTARLKPHTTARVQGVLPVVASIFRRYPGQYDACLAQLWPGPQVQLTQPEARAAMAWLLGELPGLVRGAAVVLEELLEGYSSAPLEEQQALLTAAAKLAVKAQLGAGGPSRPGSAPRMQELLRLRQLAGQALAQASRASSPLLRERALLYAHLLQGDPQEAAAVILAARPVAGEAEEGGLGAAQQGEEALQRWGEQGRHVCACMRQGVTMVSLL
jgi:hypothetical protein